MGNGVPVKLRYRILSEDEVNKNCKSPLRTGRLELVEISLDHDRASRSMELVDTSLDDGFASSHTATTASDSDVDSIESSISELTFQAQ